jgi:cruciform cutting endonuclease 1
MILQPLHSLKACQLKYAAFLMGLPSTGTKPVLESTIQQKLHSFTSRESSRTNRIVSVDMGIRNLAYCVLDLPSSLSSTQQPFKISTWQRRDLLTTTSTETQPLQDLPKSGGRRRKPATSYVDAKAFTPSVLSKTAYDITKELLAHDPTTILIERQRFRSGGAAAIQEWTVRVNMLESMLWACLHTLCSNSSSPGKDYPTAHEISPARVASFWAAGKEFPLRPAEDLFSPSAVNGGIVGITKSTESRKVQKKDKIAIAQSWLQGGNGDVQLEFEGQAAEVAQAFRSKARNVGKRSGPADSMGKLDDLADCLLQAVAWARWEQNAVALRRIFCLAR